MGVEIHRVEDPHPGGMAWGRNGGGTPPPTPTPYVYVCRASGHIGIYSLISEFPELFVPLNDYSPPRHAFLHSLQANHW
jgi:hypothetical protein